MYVGGGGVEHIGPGEGAQAGFLNLPLAVRVGPGSPFVEDSMILEPVKNVPFCYRIVRKINGPGHHISTICCRPATHQVLRECSDGDMDWSPRCEEHIAGEREVRDLEWTRSGDAATVC